MNHWRASVLTIFPDMFPGPLGHSLAGKALDNGRWCFADLLRVKGELVLREGAPNAAIAAEKFFLLSLDWARRQQTLSWELRTATSLARLRRDQHRREEARDLLRSVYARFTEGFETVDVTRAKALLDELA